MKRLISALPLVLLLISLVAPVAGALAAEPPQVSYRIDLQHADTGEITVTLELEAASAPLVLEMADEYGNGLAAGLPSHIVDEKAVDASGQTLPVVRQDNAWSIDHTGRLTFSYKMRIEDYEAGTAYLDSLAASGTPWPYFPSLDAGLAYLPGYAVFVHPRDGVYRPTLALDLPPGWKQALSWREQPADMDELLNNPIFAGELYMYEQGALLLAIPEEASAATGGSLAEYAGKAQVLLEKGENLLGGLDLGEDRRLLLALLFRGEGDSLAPSIYPSSPFSDSVVVAAGPLNDPLADATIEATTRGIVSLLLSRELILSSDANWLEEGAAWYLQDLLPYEAGLWGASLFWDRFNLHYDTYREARAESAYSMAEAGAAAYESEEAAVILTSGGASACASIDSELRSMQPAGTDLPFFLRSLSEMSGGEDPLSNDDILSALVDLTGRDWSAFFRDYIESSREIPASSFSSLNVVEPGASNVTSSPPDVEASTSDWIILVVAVLVVFIIPFVLEPYTMRPRKPGFLERELAKDDEDGED